MKTTAALMIGADTVHVSDYHLLIELGVCGRGYITAETDANCIGSLVRFDLGVGEDVDRWFTGFVVCCGDAERGFKRLFVHEFVGALSKAWPVSLQHPTLRDVCAARSSLTDLQFALPDDVIYVGNYSDLRFAGASVEIPTGEDRLFMLFNPNGGL